MNWKLKSTLGAGALLLATQAAAQVTFYEREGLQGRSFTTDRPVRNLDRQGFDDLASSAVVEAGRWEVCDDARFEGNCVVLRRGSYESLRAMGLNNRISSVRPVDTDRVGEASGPRRFHEAQILAVRPTGGSAERCWTERQPAYQSRNGDVGEAIAGAIIGRIAGETEERQVQRCERVASSEPQRWEVTYSFRGMERRALLDRQPAGRTLQVDENGEPIG